MLVRVMQLLGWDRPVTNKKHKTFHYMERELLTYVLHDQYTPWSTLFTDQQLKRAIKGIQTVFSAYGSLGYKQPSADTLGSLVERLTNRLPPIVAKIDSIGKPQLTRVEIAQTLYAGWVYWLGRKHLAKQDPLSFFLTNRLCDYALLQQRAINMTISWGSN